VTVKHIYYSLKVNRTSQCVRLNSPRWLKGGFEAFWHWQLVPWLTAVKLCDSHMRATTLQSNRVRDTGRTVVRRCLHLDGVEANLIICIYARSFTDLSFSCTKGNGGWLEDIGPNHMFFRVVKEYSSWLPTYPADIYVFKLSWDQGRAIAHT
jgi:hypothetical protein